MDISILEPVLNQSAFYNLHTKSDAFYFLLANIPVRCNETNTSSLDVNCDNFYKHDSCTGYGGCENKTEGRNSSLFNIK